MQRRRLYASILGRAPNCPKSLYRELIFISPFSIPKAIDYHFHSPISFHSTKSFNLLIGLALRSASFASVRRLFAAMQAESIPQNIETQKLRVRWFVRTGQWNDAWKHVLELTSNFNKPVPLPLWLELFGSQKRGALRHWAATPRELDVRAGTSTGRGLVSQDDGCPSRKRPILRSCQRPRVISLLRYRALMQVSPLLTSSNQVHILPRTILIITQTMHQVGQRSLALSTALSYLESLPHRLRRCDRRTLLNLINAHLSMSARHKKQGLKQHFTLRRILQKFLHARPDLIPSSTTLFLLLGSFRACRRGGTLALQCLELFEKRWGTRVQSSPVRRRVASLALKEGRLDIVATMLRLESHHRALKDPLPRSAYTSKQRPWRSIFSGRGTESRRWHLIVDKYRRQVHADVR